MASRALAYCVRSFARATARLNHGNALTRSACAPLISNQRPLCVISCSQRTRWTELVRVSFLRMENVCLCGLLLSDLPVSFRAWQLAATQSLSSMHWIHTYFNHISYYSFPAVTCEALNSWSVNLIKHQEFIHTMTVCIFTATASVSLLASFIVAFIKVAVHFKNENLVNVSFQTCMVWLHFLCGTQKILDRMTAT